MNIIKENGKSAAIVDGDTIICNSQDMLDLMATARYEHDCDTILLQKENLDEDFFDLKTGIAGEILQKISNYGFRLAVIGDFSAYKSKSLHDFIHESNKAGRILFKPNKEEALKAFASR